MIPKTTDPLTKFIRTGEGILVFAFNIALLVVPIVSKALTPDQSAKWAAIIDGVTVVSRTGLKAFAASAMASAAAQRPAADQSAIAASPSTQAIEAAAAELTSVLPEIGSVTTKLPATLSTDIADVERLVSDAEEFASTPSVLHSRPDLGAGGLPSLTRGQPVGLGRGHGAAAQPFRVRLGEEAKR